MIRNVARARFLFHSLTSHGDDAFTHHVFRIRRRPRDDHVAFPDIDSSVHENDIPEAVKRRQHARTDARGHFEDIFVEHVRQRDDLNRVFQRGEERSGFGRKRGGGHLYRVVLYLTRKFARFVSIFGNFAKCDVKTQDTRKRE